MYKSHRGRFIRISWIKYSSIKPLIVGHSFKRLWYVTHLHWNLKLNLKHRRVVKWFRDAEIVRFYTADKSIFSFGCFIWGERKKGLGGTWELSRRYKVFLLCLAHMRRSWMSENHSFPSLMRFWTLNNSVTIAQIEKLGQNTLPVCFFFKLLKDFHRMRGKKTSGSVTMSSVREFVSDFQHFSHTWCAESCWSAAAYKTLMGFWSETYSLQSQCHTFDMWTGRKNR